MRKLLIFVVLAIILAVPVSAQELTAPTVPESAMEFMPSSQESFGQGLMEVLRDAYMTYNSVDTAEIHEKFGTLRAMLPGLSPERFDELFNLVCDLCLDHELLAFSQGVAVGMDLMTEVNRLP